MQAQQECKQQQQLKHRRGANKSRNDGKSCEASSSMQKGKLQQRITAAGLPESEGKSATVEKSATSNRDTKCQMLQTVWLMVFTEIREKIVRKAINL
jgi:hypothetical protein